MRRGPKVGERYEPLERPAYVDGNDFTGRPEGYYPAERPNLRLRWVDDAPDDPRDPSGHFEVMRSEPGFRYFHGATSVDGVEDLPRGQTVALEAHAKGKARTSGRTKIVLAKIRYILRF